MRKAVFTVFSKTVKLRWYAVTAHPGRITDVPVQKWPPTHARGSRSNLHFLYSKISRPSAIALLTGSNKLYEASLNYGSALWENNVNLHANFCNIAAREYLTTLLCCWTRSKVASWKYCASEVWSSCCVDIPTQTI